MGELHVHSFVSFKTLRIQKNTINALKCKTVLESIQIVSRTYAMFLIQVFEKGTQVLDVHLGDFLSHPSPIVALPCKSLRQSMLVV